VEESEIRNMYREGDLVGGTIRFTRRRLGERMSLGEIEREGPCDYSSGPENIYSSITLNTRHKLLCFIT